MTIPQMRVNRIDTMDEHRSAFELANHPLEGSVVMLSDNGITVSPIEETYTLTESRLGTVHINITGIKQGLGSGAIPFTMYRAEATQEWHDYTMQSSGVEEEGIARLKPADLKRPAICIVWRQDFSHTTFVDGNHRICRRWRDGLTTFDFAMVIYPDVMPFVRKASPRDEQMLNISDFVRRLR